MRMTGLEELTINFFSLYINCSINSRTSSIIWLIAKYLRLKILYYSLLRLVSEKNRVGMTKRTPFTEFARLTKEAGVFLGVVVK